MNEETIKHIIQKYKAGESSLEEEKILFDSVEKTKESIQTWASFVKKSRITSPENLNEKLWTSFEMKTKKPNKFRIGMFSAAASIALIFSIFIYNNHQNKLSESEKSALLEEARNMFVDENKQQEIYQKILENELIIVYTKVN